MSDNINLTQQTRIKTNPISTNCICLLPDKKSTKVFIAHAKGVHIYDNISKKIENVKLQEGSGSASCITQSDDLVFFCYGMKIYACGTNGKTLFEADTYLAVDKIEALHVYGYQLWVVTGNMVNEFLIGGGQLNNKFSRITPPPLQQIQDIDCLIFDVKINHSLLLKLQAQKPFLLLLKNNNQIEIAQKKDPVTFTTESPPTYGYLYPSQNKNKVLVGTMSGELIYLEVGRKKINKIWSIKENSKGKINCIVEVKNGFIVFRDGVFEMWNANQELLGKEELSSKIESALYLPQDQSLFYGTSEGQVVQMYDYEKMMRLSKQRGQASNKMKIIQEIEQLRKLKESLKAKANEFGLAMEKVTGTGKKIQLETSIGLDFVNLCSSLEVRSERPIIKLVLRGNITLLESSDSILFSGLDKENAMVYSVRTEQKKLLTVRFKFEQKYQENDKLVLMIFYDMEGKLIANKQSIDLKMLSLHQKVASKLLDASNLKANALRITGEFKYFLMNAWLNSIFNDFGSPSPQNGESIQMCYESIITKNRVYLQFQNGQCIFYSESPTPLTVIKKCIFQKSKEKNLSLSYDSKTNIQGLSNLLKKMGSKLKKFEENKKEYNLLPGIQEIADEELSNDLKSILNRSEQIKKFYNESTREYEELKNSIKEFYINYRTLNNWDVNEYQLQELSKQLEDFQPGKIIKMIQS